MNAIDYVAKKTSYIYILEGDSRIYGLEKSNI